MIVLEKDAATYSAARLFVDILSIPLQFVMSFPNENNKFKGINVWTAYGTITITQEAKKLKMHL